MKIEFKKLSKTNDNYLRRIFEIVGEKLPKGVYDASAMTSPLVHDSSEIDEIRKIQYNEVFSSQRRDGRVLTLSKFKKDLKDDKGLVLDSFFNPVTGTGTPRDPSYYNTADVPISLTPYEATSLYASGGLARKIIDKKVDGLFVNGFCFDGANWEASELEDLRQYADSLNAETHLKNVFRDGLIYGGSAIVPHFKNDNVFTYLNNKQELKSFVKKDSIERFWTVDRWNLVLVPKWNVQASDYLHPETMYCPIAGLDINTARMSLIRPNQLPYWGALRQLGWGQSDLTMWIKSVLAYEMAIGPISIMSNQMSLLYHHIPLDAITFQNGPDSVKDWAEENSKQLSAWNSVTPKTINSFGELKTIERNYQGFPDLITILRQDIAAKSEIPESVLFHTQATGFVDNDSDTSVKQAETLKKVGNDLAPQLKEFCYWLVYSCFGPDSPQAKKVDSLKIVFDSPTVVTEESRAKMGNNFSSIVQTLVGAGATLESAAKVAKVFIPWTGFTDEDVKSLEKDLTQMDNGSMEKPSSDPGSENDQRKKDSNNQKGKK